jgi:hypothetical protein
MVLFNESRQRPRGIDDMLRVDSKFFHHFRSRRAQTKTVQSDNFSVEPDVLIPNLRHTRLNRDASAAFFR